MEKITDLPKVDFDRCTGCTLCVAQCPGQAIFVVDASQDGEEALLSLQYDMGEPPDPGDRVVLLDREGNSVGEGKVVKVYKHKRSEAFVVTIAIPQKLLMVARAFRKVGRGES